jgi:LPXTG-motif cell wall-anchored protein
VSQQDTPGQYVNSTGGLLTNISDNKITSVKVSGNNRMPSFWSNGKLYYAGLISIVGDNAVNGYDFLSGANNGPLVDASSRLTADMTIDQAQAALSPGEWGTVDKGDGTWLWAYKTGDPSEGTVLDADGLIAALQAAGVEMTADDIAKTKAQTEFIARTHNYVNVTFEDPTINGTVLNTMGNGMGQSSTVIPGSSSEVPGRIMISYIDDTTGGSLLTAETDSGTTGDVSDYSTADMIKHYQSLGYVLVSDSYSKEPVKFGGLGSLTPFEVHFVHGTKALPNEPKDVTQTIKYVYADNTADDETDNKPTSEKDNTQTVSFTRTVTEDLVHPGDSAYYTYGEWTPASGDYTDVDSPVIPGYSADKSSVAGSSVTPTSEDSTIYVHYTADTQKVVYNVIDDKDGEKLEDTVDFDSGTTDTPLTKTQTDLESIIKGYTDQGYELVSSDPIPPKFDSDTAKDQVINIHLKHHLTTTTETKEVDETIHYVYEEDGSKAAEDVTDKVTFTRDTVTDDVTKESTVGEWTAVDNDSTFDEKVSPTISGYMADQASIAAITGLSADSENVEKTVTYKKAAEPTPSPAGEDTTPTPEASKPAQQVVLPKGTPAKAETPKAAVLPSTGEKAAGEIAVLGAALAIGAGILGAFSLHRRKKH